MRPDVVYTALLGLTVTVLFITFVRCGLMILGLP